MQGPIAVFGTTSQEFTEKVFQLRKKVRDLRYEENPEEILTVPHLTLAWKKDFDFSKAERVKEFVGDVVKELHPFFLGIKSFEIMDQNIAAKFDNSFSNELAQKINDQLKDLGFKVVVTDYMKLIRSKIKPEHLEKVKQMVEKNIPKKIEIISIALAGHLIRDEDFIWDIKL